MQSNKATNPNFSLLFCCAGLGMGNASRITAIIEELNNFFDEQNKSDMEFIIATWGAGFNFFQDYIKNSDINIKIIQLHDYNHWLNYPMTYLLNTFKIFQVIKNHHIKIGIIDSDYHFLPLKLNQIKTISISQAPDVIKRSIENKYRPQNLTEYLTLIFREKIDYIFQYIMADKILVPSFKPEKSISSQKSFPIPLIVRREFLQSEKSEKSKELSIGVLLSGSGIEKNKFIELKRKFNFTVISPDFKRNNIICHAKELDKFDILFTQGGLSSISEVIAKNKFLVVFPIKNHPEQTLNAIEVQKLGLGLKAEWEQLDNLNQFKSFIFEIINKNKQTTVDCNGAQIAAQYIYNDLFELKTKI